MIPNNFLGNHASIVSLFVAKKYLFVLIQPAECESGIKHLQQYEKLKEKLRAFDDLAVTQQDYEQAAAMYNTCRGKGVQGFHIDFLICAIADRADTPIFAVDGDFEQYAPYLPIKLYPAANVNRTYNNQAN